MNFKNITKNLIVFLAAVIVLGYSGFAYAQTGGSMFNTAPNDLATVKVSNVTQNPGSSLNWQSSITANPNDIVAARVSYHNTGVATASNTTIRMSPQISASVHSQSFTGNIAATNLSANCYNCNGSATISVSGSQGQTFTFIPGSVRWYPDSPVSTQVVTFSASQELQLFGQGINIGSILPDSTCPTYQTFCHQGTLNIQYRVSNNQPQQACAINSFTANPSSVSYNGSSTLSWSTNGNNVSISGISGTFGGNGSTSTGPLTSTRSYTLTVTGTNCTSQSQTITVSVGSAPVCSITSFTASPSTVAYNGTSTLSWSSNNVSYASISGVTGTFGGNGSTSTGSIQNTTTYTLTAHCGDGSTKTRTVTVFVGSAPVCAINSFTASPSSVSYNGTSTLTWNTQNATSASINTIGPVALSDSLQVGPLQSTTSYTLTINCANGTTKVKTISVYVSPQQNQAQPLCKINSFSAAPSTVAYGSPANLYWSTSNCTDVSISGLGSQIMSGSASTGNLIATTAFTLTADGASGSTQTKTVTVYVSQQPSQGYCAITSFNASPASVNYNETTTLVWATSNDCTNVSISSIGNVGTSGSVVTNPLYATTNYTLSASILGGAIQTRSIVVNVHTVSQPTYQCNDGQDNDGDGLTDYPNDPGCSSPTDTSEYNYVQTTYACNDHLDNDGDSLIDYPQDPGCSSATDTDEYNFIQPPQTYACNDHLDNDSDGLVDYPNDPGCYSYSDTDEYNYVQPPVSQLAVSTLVASGVGQTSANLNGYVTTNNTSNSTTSVWFQWGLDRSLGAVTQTQTVNGSVTFSAPVYNLAPSTTYYFRAVASNGYNGTVYGDILSFRTQAQTNNNPVIIYTGGGTGTGVPLMTLTIDTPFETVSVGDTINYTIKYKNIANRTTLHDVVVFIQFPKNVDFVRSTNGQYSLPDNTLTVNVGTLAPQEEGTIFADVTISPRAKNGDLLVTSGTATYITPTNTQGDVIAFEQNTVAKNANSFLAGLALFGADGILPTTLIGWLILILVVLLLIMIGRRVFAPTRVVKHVSPTQSMPH